MVTVEDITSGCIATILLAPFGGGSPTARPPRCRRLHLDRCQPRRRLRRYRRSRHRASPLSYRSSRLSSNCQWGSRCPHDPIESPERRVSCFDAGSTNAFGSIREMATHAVVSRCSSGNARRPSVSVNSADRRSASQASRHDTLNGCRPRWSANLCRTTRCPRGPWAHGRPGSARETRATPRSAGRSPPSRTYWPRGPLHMECPSHEIAFAAQFFFGHACHVDRLELVIRDFDLAGLRVDAGSVRGGHQVARVGALRASPQVRSKCHPASDSGRGDAADSDDSPRLPAWMTRRHRWCNRYNTELRLQNRLAGDAL